jgi:hypothetical protein
VWTDLTKMKVQASAMKAAKFWAVFSQRKAMRLNRLSSRVDPVPSDESLPARADVVGIIGTSAALFLAQRGVSVALVL